MPGFLGEFLMGSLSGTFLGGFLSLFGVFFAGVVLPCLVFSVVSVILGFLFGV